MSLYSAFYDDWNPDKVRPADFKIVERKFDRAFGRRGKAVGEVLALRKGIPIHFGVLTENFQPIEKHHRLTLKFLRFLKEYDYPIIISTKSDLILAPEYFKAVTDLNKVIIQVSFTTTNPKTSKLLDGNAPIPDKRLEILHTFKSAGVRSIMRLAPIIAPVTDQELFQSITDGVEMADIDGVLMKGFFFGANKTLSRFFEATFGTDLYEYYRDSGTKPYDGANVCYHAQAQNLFLIKAINLAESLGVSGMTDTCLSPFVSSQHHCCGGDGLKGFNPNSEEDLAKVRRFNLSNSRYYVYKAWKTGKFTRKDFEALPKLNGFHRKQMDAYFNAGIETTWCTFLDFDGDDYTFDYDDEFYKEIMRLKKEKELLQEGEMMEQQKKFVGEY